MRWRDMFGLLTVAGALGIPAAARAQGGAGTVAPAPERAPSGLSATGITPVVTPEIYQPKKPDIPAGDHPVRREVIRFIQRMPGAGAKKVQLALLQTLEVAPQVRKERRLQVVSSPLGYLIDVEYASVQDFRGTTDDRRLASPKSPFSTWPGPCGRTGLFSLPNGKLAASWYFLTPADEKLSYTLAKEKKSKGIAWDAKDKKVLGSVEAAANRPGAVAKEPNP
jgi:hypothetical protein